MRLQKFLAQAGVASRRSAEELIKRGAVLVNGEPVVTAWAPTWTPRTTGSRCRARRVRPAAPMYRLLLKPRGCLSTLCARRRGEEAQAGRSAERWPTLDRCPIAWLAGGGAARFSRRGRVLLTTDGELAQRSGDGAAR